MMRLPRFLSCAAVACSLAVPAAFSSWTLAQDAAVASAPSAPSADLIKTVDNFWHYAKIARYPLAAEEGKKILDMKDQPLVVLQAFEKVADQHRDNLEEWLLRWQGVNELRDVTAQLLTTLSQGQFARRSDPKFVDDNIKRLTVNERAFASAVEQLRNSGELAYPQMIDYLRDANKREYHMAIRRAMRSLGRVGLNPLAAATSMKDANALPIVVTVLGELGYDAAVPYLARVAQDKEAPASARSAAQEALQRMGAGESLNLADLFYNLAEKFYYGNASLVADKNNPVAYVWSWDDAKGLVAKPVPPVIFNDVMAMRSAKDALQANSGKSEAVALWLAANYKREADLPQGAVDPTAPADSAHFYGVSAGTRYLNDVIRRGLTDRNAAVALRSIKSLEEIAGQSNLFDGGQPILDALTYPDRQVRFESAFTLASALPQKSFQNAERVVPILAEALSQSGKANLLVVAPNDQLTPLSEGLKAAGYGVEGGNDVQSAVARSKALPAVDVVLFSASLDEGQVASLLTAVKDTPALQGAGLVVMSPDRGTSYARWAVVTQAKDAAGMKPQIEEARAKTGGLPLEEKTATGYALRAGALLEEIAVNRSEVFDLSVAESGLLRALDDARPELVKEAAGVLSYLAGKQSQAGLLTKALDEKAAEDVRISVFKSLADSAKRHGNQLDGDQVKSLTKAVQSAGSAELKAAAAEARGALNLPSDEAAALILGAKLGEGKATAPATAPAEAH